MGSSQTQIVVRRPGAAKRDPFTIVIVANPALEAPLDSGNFVSDPILLDPTGFADCVRYIDDALFGNLPNQREILLGDHSIAPQVRMVTVFDPGLSALDSNSLVSQDTLSDELMPRRNVFAPFLATYGLEADIAYAVSASVSHTRATTWFTTDDDGRPGVQFDLDGTTLYHRFYCQVPGTIAIHRNADSLTALHEFQHGISSYSNGSIVDLYVDVSPGVNAKAGRPIPPGFATYVRRNYLSDPLRNGLSYPPNWQAYHCELISAGLPAIMDDYYQANGPSEACENDAITRQFILDRVRAKLSR